MKEEPERLPAAISILRSTKGNLNKRITLRVMGNGVTTEHPAPMSEGFAFYHPVPTSDELAALLQGMTKERALVLGTLKDPKEYDLPVLSKRKGRLATKRHIVRSRQHFHFDSNRDTWVLLDYDTKYMPPRVTRRVAELGGWFDAMLRLWPQLAQADRVDTASSSSHVYYPDGTLFREAATHTYARYYQPGISQKELLDDLMLRGWLEGLSYWHIGSAGQLLDRGIIDATVGSPERLSFEAPPDLVGGLTRAAPPPRVTHGVCVGYTALTPAERSRALEIRRKAKAALAVEAEAVRTAWIIARAKAMAVERGITHEQALATVKGVFLGDRQLVGEYAVLLSDKTTATVNQILDDPHRYQMVDGPGILDGPEYGWSRIQIYTLTKEGKPLARPFIYDYSHGDTVKYKLVRVSTQPSVVLDREVLWQQDDDTPRATTWSEQKKKLDLRNDYQLTQHIRLWKTWFLPFLDARKNKPSENAKNYDKRMKAYKEHEDIINAPRWWDGSQTGVGKSHAMCDFLHWVTTDHHSGWKRDKHGKLVVVLERHEQVDKVLERLAGLNVVALRGRGKVCEYPDLIGKFGGLVASIENSVCRHCPLYEECFYYAQIEEAKKADIVVMVREMAYHNPASLIGKRVAMWLFDEDQTSSLIEGEVQVTLGDLRPTLDGTYIPPRVANVLARLSATLEKSHRGNALLPLNDPDLDEAIEYFAPQHGFGIEACADIANFGELLKNKLDTAGPVMQWRKRLYAFLCALQTSQPHVPGVYVGQAVLPRQLPQPCFVLVQRKSVEGITACRNAPRVLYSATAQEYWNSLGLCFGPPDRDNIPLPDYVIVRFMDGHSGSKSSLVDPSSKPTKLLEYLAHHYEVQASGQPALWLAQKGVNDAVNDRLNKETAIMMHHGATTSSNAAQGVAYTLSVGRALPSYVVYEAQVEALTGRCVERLSPNEPYWPRADGWVRCGPTHMLSTTVYTHPDATVAAYLDYQLRTQVEQGTGRPRAIRAEGPMVIDIFGQIPVGYPVDELGTLQEFLVGPEEAAWRQGLVPLSSEAVHKVAAALYPKAYGCPERVQKALENERAARRVSAEAESLRLAAGASPIFRFAAPSEPLRPAHDKVFIVPVLEGSRGVPLGFLPGFTKKDAEELINKLFNTQKLGRYRGK